MTCSKDTVKATGLNIWASGRENQDGPEIDVIAVQGLGAHPYYTWVRKHDPIEEIKPRRRRPLDFLRGRQKNIQVDGAHIIAQTRSDPAEVMWLRDILPGLITNARIATYSYESDWRKRDVKTSLRQCGEQLLNVLHQHRLSEKESRRPLVFIGHSLGGLVIQQALVLANHGDDFRDIRLSTAGIIFLGTPHQGSDSAVYGVWLAQAARHDKTLLESLKKCSPVLHDIARDFETSYRSVDVVCFYENKEASYGPWRTQFVDHQSASLHGRRMMYLTTDHSGLNKFGGVEDENFALVLPEIQRMIQVAAQKVEERYRSHAVISKKESFSVDFSLRGIPVVNRFVARDAEMSRMKQVLLPILTDQMRRKVFVLHGLGGIGKTQLSVAFAREYQGSYSAVFWIDGSTKEKLKRSITDLASRLPQDQISERSRNYSPGKGTDMDEVIKDILEWLSRRLNDRWLLIFDNVDREFSISSSDPEAFDVKEYFPPADQGSILITSRLASLQQLGFGMKLKSVDEQQGNIILENSLGRSAEGSAELVKLLQGLPLAINQAGSYIQGTGIDIPEYIRSYNETWIKLIETQNLINLQTDTDRSVLTTWTVSFNHLKTQSEDAANLLMLWAFLDNRDLWYELLTPALEGFADEMPGWFTRCVGEKLAFNKSVGLLLRYSFIDVKAESSAFSMHSVLHRWCFYVFEGEKTDMSWLAAMVIASAVPSESVPHYPLIQRRLLPHCDRIFSLLRKWAQETSSDLADLPSRSYACHELGDLYSAQGKIKEAEEMYLRALAGKEKAWGAEHTATLDTVNTLGNLYVNLGKTKKAEEMYLRVLAGYEKAWGPEHAAILDKVNNLGILYWNQGKIKEAEKMYLRALVGKEKVWSVEHTSTLNTVNNLGLLYWNQGKMKKAEEMYLRALVGKEKAWGAEHTSTLDTINNLGVLYWDQGKMKEAEEMYLRALAGYEKAWGPEHTSTLDTVNNLGVLYRKQGTMKEAENMYIRALTGYKKAWGPEYTSTLKIFNNLGNLYLIQGKMEEAEEMYLRALTGYEKAWGTKHKDPLDIRYNLTFIYKNLSMFEDAAKHFELVVEGYTEVLGSGHSKTVEALKQLDYCLSMGIPPS